jgi:hypothetical protein
LTNFWRNIADRDFVIVSDAKVGKMGGNELKANVSHHLAL